MTTTVLTLLNVILGFVFQSAVAATMGLSGASDSFQLAWSIVTFGTVLFFTLVPILLVPRLENPITREIGLGDWPKFVMLGTVLTLAQLLIANYCEPGLADILRWSAPSHLFAAMTAIPLAVAYIRKRFVVAGIGPAINGAALLGSFMLTGTTQQPSSIGACLTIGYMCQMIFVGVFSMNRGGPFGVGSHISIRLYVFLVGFTLLSKFQPLLERFLSVVGPTGSTATLGFGQKLAQGLLLFAAFGLALTANATLARKVKSEDLESAADLMAKTVVTTIVFSAIVLLVALPLKDLVIRVLFVRGEFTSSDAADVGDVLLCQLPWVIACAITGALTSYLYIERSYVRVATAAVIGLVVTFIVSRLLQQAFELTAVPIASSAGAVVTLFWIIWLVARSPIWPHLRRKLGAYRTLLYFSSFSVIVSFGISVISRLTVGSDVGLTNVLLGFFFIVSVLFIRFYRPIWKQCRAATGGKL
ncbi:lipid II flippase MurJ [Arthrobacter sp. efr-133-TYG-120]|uniref:lipid II flippase MurJ n=1 Tax=Arthrobacter sp. efr-133-TYG-120 TaxID=3040280 RepID=UPI00255059B1|nr:lipid II flippase MurJ [Arthrobacter sp. efr-133-TYG-120]